MKPAATGGTVTGWGGAKSRMRARPGRCFFEIIPCSANAASRSTNRNTAADAKIAGPLGNIITARVAAFRLEIAAITQGYGVPTVCVFQVSVAAHGADAADGWVNARRIIRCTTETAVRPRTATGL